MARLRVFLCTYRRPHLLRRALRSLLAQTCTDWTCELHNDAPDDDAPRKILAELAPNDARFSYHAHEQNWGAVATFNHAFAGGPEPLASILEDDNWWEPEFLARVTSVLQQRPEAALAWANMHRWTEEPDGSWRPNNATIWKTSGNVPAVVEFHWPELIQAFDALHSNGATVFRPRFFRNRAVPAATPLALIECIRERDAIGPMLFLPDPLAHFAHTRTTARSTDATAWLQAKLLLATSFFLRHRVAPDALSAMWSVRAALAPRDTDIFFLIALLLSDRRFIQQATVSDWLHFLLRTMRHPWRFWRSLRYRTEHPDIWKWLLDSPAAAHDFAAVSVLTKTIGAVAPRSTVSSA